VQIAKVRDETPTIKSFTFHDKLAAKASPGQFVMIWIPTVDEVPMSLSSINPHESSASITVEKVGEATGKLHQMKAGNLVGIRGPFGKGYSLTRARNVMIVGGGTGMASLAPFTEQMVEKKGCKVTFLLGAKTSSELLFLDRMKNLLASAKGRMVATTQDGSYGTKGLVTKSAEQLLAKETFDMIYSCGPERMMQKMFFLAEQLHVPFQASLERFMRCAIGLCGTCIIGKYRVCKDGPVFLGEQLREVKEEFGYFRRGLDGRKTSI